MSVLKPRNVLLLLALILAVVLGSLIAVRYQAVDDVKAVVEALPAGVDLALEGIDYTHSQGGVNRWRLIAERAEHVSAEGVIKVQKPDLVFFDQTGARQASLTGLTGQVDRDFSRVEVHGEVSVKTVDGYLLQTQELFFDAAGQRVYTDAPVMITGQGLRVTGTGMRVTLERHRVELLADVEARIEPKVLGKDRK